MIHNAPLSSYPLSFPPNHQGVLIIGERDPMPAVPFLLSHCYSDLQVGTACSLDKPVPEVGGFLLNSQQILRALRCRSHHNWALIAVVSAYRLVHQSLRVGEVAMVLIRAPLAHYIAVVTMVPDNHHQNRSQSCSVKEEKPVFGAHLVLWKVHVEDLEAGSCPLGILVLLSDRSDQYIAAQALKVWKTRSYIVVLEVQMIDHHLNTDHSRIAFVVVGDHIPHLLPRHIRHLDHMSLGVHTGLEVHKDLGAMTDHILFLVCSWPVDLENRICLVRLVLG